MKHNNPDPLRIILDYDGVMVRTNDFACAVMSAATGEEVTARDLLDYDFVHSTPERDKAFWLAYDIMDNTGARLGLKPYDAFTTEVAREFADHFPNLRIVTCNDPKAAPSIQAWLRHHSIPLRVECIGREPKVPKHEMSADVFIEDNPKIVEHFDVIRRWSTWLELYTLLMHVEWLHKIGSLQGRVLLLANTRWNEHVQDKGDL